MAFDKVQLDGPERASGLGAVLLLFLLLLPVEWAAAAPAARAEDEVYVYDLFVEGANCGTVLARLKQLPLRPTLILSVEQGKRFLLDDPAGNRLLACVLDHLRGSDRTVKAMLLQDPSFTERTGEAVRRAARLGQFVKQHPGRLAGAHIDVEPYTTEEWSCGDAEERGRLVQELHQLLDLVRQQLRGLPLGAAVPSWFPRISDEVPEAAPEALFSVADEIYLMTYGDKGGPVVGGTANRVLRRVDAPEFFSGTGRMYIALASYEFPSAADLETTVGTVHQRLDRHANFAGTAVFHAASVFKAPLLRLVSGQVVDEAGEGVAGVNIDAGEIRKRSNKCGKFVLRGVPEGQAELILEKGGLPHSESFPSALAAPGRIRDLGNIVLEKDE